MERQGDSYCCPRHGCGWKFDPPQLELRPGGHFDDFRAALEANLETVETVLAEHLKTHDG